MTDSSAKEFGSEVLIDANSSSAVDLEVVNVVATSNIIKNDIRVSEEGVAKLTFNFLDDMQGGDSSLEPGEVKTPPPGSSPLRAKEATPSRLAQVIHTELPAKQLAKETLAKALKTVSQLEAEACEEKVRAILELDAKRRKEEVEKKRLEAEKRRQSGEVDIEVERKRKAKEERRKLKKLKRAKKAAEKVLASCEEESDEKEKQKKIKKPTESEESEGLCSSGDDDDDDNKEVKCSASDKQSTVLNSAIAIPVRYPPHLPPPPHIMQEAFLSGYRPMNPFMRAPRPDFVHGRGGFMPRGRCGMRGRMPFQGFRPPFFANTGMIAGGSGMLKFNVPHGQQQQRHHTPPPNRGHSPILPPTSDLQWTKCKPSLSYAFKFNKDNKPQSSYAELKSQHSNRIKTDEDFDGEKYTEAGHDNAKDSDRQSHLKEQTHKKNRKYKSPLKEKKKSKKHKEKDLKNSKKRRSSQQLLVSSVALIKQKKSNKSSRKKIEKIRKSYGSTSRSTPTLQQQHSLDNTEILTKQTQNDYDEEDKSDTTSENELDKMPDEDEIRTKIENIKKEKIETTELKIEDLTLKLKPLIMVKTEPEEEENATANKNEKEEQKKENKYTSQESSKFFDIFADSPLSSEASSNHTKKPSADKGTVEHGIATPPLPVTNDTKVQKSPLQNAIEIQKRIDKLLQQDDIKLEAIEAAKNSLLKKTQKYQNSKEEATLLERDKNKFSEQSTSDCTKVNSSLKLDVSNAKEKPKAYKDKESNKKSKDDDKHREKVEDTYKRIDDKESKHKESSSTLKDKSKDSRKDDKKNRDHDNKDNDRDKSRKEISSKYRNPFKRSISRDRFFGKIDTRRRTRTKSRERDYSTKRRLSNDRRRGDSSGYSSSRISSNQRSSGGSLNRSRSGDRETKSYVDTSHSKDKDRKDKLREKTPELKQKRKFSSSPKRKTDKEKDNVKESKSQDQTHITDVNSSTPPTKLIKKDDKSQQAKSKETKKSKSPVKPVPKKRPLSFTQTEFLFPEEGNVDDFIIADNEETNDSFKNLKTPSDKQDSPDTDDYMDNWENDEDVDLDMNSNLPTDVSTPRKSSPDLTEEDSFVTRFVNPSPPSEILQKQVLLENKNVDGNNDNSLPLTPPLDLLRKPQENLNIERGQEISKRNDESSESKKPELFGMQEIYDQFIKSVEASGASIKTDNIDQLREPENSTLIVNIPNDVIETEITAHNQSEDPMSTSSTSTSSSSSSSSSSDTNSSSNSSTSSSSASSSEDSNDGDKFKKSIKYSTIKIKQEGNVTTTTSSSANDNTSNDLDDMASKTNIIKNDQKFEREPRTPSPTPLQKKLLSNQTPSTTTQNKVTPKSDVAKDFKKLKNLEANLSRIQMMRANYDSNDEISEELHKMEILFLQEKKLILQKYTKNTQHVEKTPPSVNTKAEFVPALPVNDFNILPPPPPPEEPNKIFDANRETIKLTISPLKLPSKSAIFNNSLTEETEKKISDDRDEMDFTEKLVKPAKEVAIVKPMMETKESKESRSRDNHRHRRSPVYGSRERQRSPSNYRERNRRSSSRSRLSPQRRGRGRSLSLSPPRRGSGVRHGTPPRRGAPGSRFRAPNRRSRSRSRSPLRSFGNRRGKESSPYRQRKRGQLSDSQGHYKKFSRHRNSRSRSPKSPQARPRSPRTPPPRRRSYSQERYSRSPLPFKPPSPPMRHSLSPINSTSSLSRRSRSTSPRGPRSPRSPRSPVSPRFPLSPKSPRSPDSPPHRYDDHRYRRGNSFDRHASISPHPQYYAADSNVSSQTPSYYYNVSPNRISLDARINIVLNTPSGDRETPPTSYEGYTNYAQYSGAAYMSLPPQPVADTSNNMGYFQNPYVPVMPPAHDTHHALPPPNSHPMHSTPSHLPSHLQHSPAYSNIPTISSGISGATSSPLASNNFYYNDFNVTHQQTVNPVLKELPKAPVAVQKGNVLEIVPSSVENSIQSPQTTKTKTSPDQTQVNKPSPISRKNDANNRKGGGEKRSILKRSESSDKPDKSEKKKVNFEDGIYPNRDSDDEDRKLIEIKIRKKVLRLRKKRGIDVPAARDIVSDRSRIKQEKPKIDAALEKLPPPPPPATLTPSNIEQPIYLRPPTPVPLVYFHFDSVVHSMYVSQLEKPIPPRLLNPKCVPPGAVSTASSAGAGVGNGNATNNPATQSPNHNITPGSSMSGVAGPTNSKKELSTLAALNRVSRNENLMSSPKMMGDPKRDSPNLQQSPIMSISKPCSMHFAPTQISPQMSPLHGPPVIRHPPSPIGFVGMRINNFMRLPPSPLARAAIPPPHMQTPPPNMANMPPGHHHMMPMRHPHYNMPPPNLMPPGMPPDVSYNPHGGNGGNSPYGNIQAPPPGFHGYGQRPMNPGFFMSTPPSHTIHPPPPMHPNPHFKDKDHVLHHQQHQQHQHHPHANQHIHPQAQLVHQHKPPPPLPSPHIGNNVVGASPQAMIAPFNVKKSLN